MTGKPKHLEVVRSVWNDGFHGYNVIWAFFDKPQINIPIGWELVRRGPSFTETVYKKHWPYGTAVINGRIVI